jgi:hypothetical protein
MHGRAQELKLPWPKLEAGDIGNLISFLNAPVEEQKRVSRLFRYPQ